MAVVNLPKSGSVTEQNHPTWNDFFGPEERERMLREDSTAFSIVSLELVSIVCLGFALVGFTVVSILLGA